MMAFIKCYFFVYLLLRACVTVKEVEKMANKRFFSSPSTGERPVELDTFRDKYVWNRLINKLHGLQETKQTWSNQL